MTTVRTVLRVELTDAPETNRRFRACFEYSDNTTTHPHWLHAYGSTPGTALAELHRQIGESTVWTDCLVDPNAPTLAPP
jgi:hypothetical protein